MHLRAAKASAQRQGGTNYVVGTSWSALGPAPLPSDASGIGIQDYNYVSGRATSIAVDPNDLGGNTFYVGGAYGGVWKSTKAGALTPDPSQVPWTAMSDSQATLAIGAIAVQPQNSPNPDASKSVVLAGTGDANSAADSYYGLGILRSTDAGAHWTLIASANSGARPFAGLAFSRIAFNTTSPNVVVAAATASALGVSEGAENPVAVNRGLYSSSDGGASWNYASVQDSGTAIAPDSAVAVAYNAGVGKFFAAAVSRVLFVERWNQLGANQHATWDRTHQCSVPGQSGFYFVPHLSRGNCRGAGAERDVRVVRRRELGGPGDLSFARRRQCMVADRRVRADGLRRHLWLRDRTRHLQSRSGCGS
jgi:hypothetical protein